MTTTAISTTKASQETTNLTIETTEVLNLEQMGKQPIRLNRGLNKIPVGRGVFKLSSKSRVIVTADTVDPVVVIMTTETKDGSWPDPSALNVSEDGAADVHDFFNDGLGIAVK